MSDRRRLIVVDTETTGLGPDAELLEVAAVDVDSGDVVHYVPAVSGRAFDAADPYALQVNRYFERGAWRNRLSTTDTVVRCQQLVDLLAGVTIAGANPRFDVAVLRKHINLVLDGGGPVLREEPWHYRIADLEAFAAGRLNIHPAELPGQPEVCDRLGVINEEPHSALGDARAAAECFRRLIQASGGVS